MLNFLDLNSIPEKTELKIPRPDPLPQQTVPPVTPVQAIQPHQPVPAAPVSTPTRTPRAASAAKPRGWCASLVKIYFCRAANNYSPESVDSTNYSVQCQRLTTGKDV